MEGNTCETFQKSIFVRLKKTRTRVFHILDSLPGVAGGPKDTSRLQLILLKHFEGARFEEGRIRTNIAQVFDIIQIHGFIG